MAVFYRKQNIQKRLVDFEFHKHPFNGTLRMSSHLSRESLYKWYINPFYKDDDHPNHKENNRSLDRSTYRKF